MVLVELASGYKRWRYDDFSIVRGEQKDCPEEIFAVCNGRLVAVMQPKKEKKTTPKKKEKDDTGVSSDMLGFEEEDRI